jgi:outer membrane biosynthesis protein TonB
VKLDQIRWDSVAKIGAGVLLAVAIATSLPSLLGSDQPEPLEPDVGLPLAAPPPPAPPVAPPSAKPANLKKHMPRKKPARRHRHRPPHKPKPSDGSGSGPLVAVVPVPAVPSGFAEDFGFERP